tara:strand:+ start:43130 stop:45517 length:2388 start_codon:yes stop_codon:yes gene_type:complete
MAKGSVLILICLMSFMAIGQSMIPASEMDSLKKIWDSKEESDTSRLNALKHIAYKGYLRIQPDSTLILAEKGIKFAESNGQMKYVADLFNLKGLAYKAKSQFDKSISSYEKSLSISKEIGEKKIEGKAYSNIAVVYSIQRKYEKSISYSKKAIESHKSTDYKRGVVGGYNDLGATYFSMGEYDKAIENFDRATELLADEEDQEMRALITGNIGIIYQVKGDLAHAIEYIRRAVAIYEAAEIKDKMAGGLSNIGVIYRKMEQNEKALEYFHQALSIYEEYNNEVGMMDLNNNIAVVHSAKGEYDQAEKFYEKSREIAEKLDDPNGISNSLHNIGLLHMRKGDYDKSLKLLLEAKKMREKYELNRNLISSFTALSEVYFKQNNIQQALKYGEEGYKRAKDRGDIKEIKSAANILYQVHQKLNNSDRSLEMYMEYIKLRDSIKSEENQKEIIHQEYKYEYEKQSALDSVENAKKQRIAQSIIEKEKAENARKQTIQYALIGGLALVLVFAGLVLNRFRITSKQKKLIEKQKQQVDSAYSQLEEKNSEILDSINYAKRIQSAILPPPKLVKTYLTDSFVLYKPKDIVAGDFYWMEPREDGVMFAAADCTGHGVPGAMVSVVCNNGLNRSVREHGIKEPAKILDKTREIVIQEFEKSEEEVKDGMDIALCSLKEVDEGKSTLEFAGAHNPLWIIRKGASTIEEIKGDKQPIGKFGLQKPFTNHRVELNAGDTIYLFSDGFADQFGGENGKKFKSRNFKNLLLSIVSSPMNEQKEMIDKAFEEWRGDNEQLDDVCVIGLRV